MDAIWGHVTCVLSSVWESATRDTFAIVTTILAAITLFAVLSYLLPLVWAGLFHGVQDLKKKYRAQWAVVTGGSSGLGKAIVNRCAQQGLNVVIIALDDPLLASTLREMAIAFPHLQFRGVGVDLGQPASRDYDYMSNIHKATRDIDIQIVFNNAGFLAMGNFMKVPLGKLVANAECNVMSHVKIGHHFMRLMMEKGLPGCVCFTGSASAFFPAPGSAIYAAGKRFLEQLVVSLAVDGKPYGIDVTVVLPGYIHTNLYQDNPKLDALKFFASMGSTADDVAKILFRSIGRFIVRDTSMYCHFTRLLMKALPVDLLDWIIIKAMPYTADYKNHEIMR